MDSLRRKVLGRSLPKLGKSRRERRSETFKRRQREREELCFVSGAYDFRGQEMA